ncbi:nickel-binding protein NikA [Chloropicon roscoffensis]|uniref:Nickel-binding protein NikA n=1 Tax=Chloropicon roscoffensis TaxID=1461544 RepID=A0AAX4P4N4_9CHLO
MKIAAWVILIALSAVSTVVRSTSPEDELVFGQTFMADSMNATDGSNGWALVSHGIAQNLFTVSQEGEIVPQVAEKVSRVSSNEFKIHIKPNIKFSDGTPVTAADVAKALQTANEQNPNAQSSLGSIEAEPLDDNTVHVVSEDPTHIPESVLAEWAWPIFKVNDEGGYVFTGPYQVDEFADGEHIKLSPNEYYPGHEKSLPAVSDADGIQGRSFPVGYTNMAVYNLCNASSPIQDIRVRQALDVAISREEMSESLAGGNPTRSFFPAETPFFYEPAEPAEPTEPAELLDAAGWTLDPETGKRTNSEGEDLELRVVAYPHRPGLPVLAGVIEETLRSLGIKVNVKVTGDDWDETQKIIDDGDFDILLWAQHSLPAGDPLWFLNAFFGSGNAKNMGCYNSVIYRGRDA